MKKAAPGGRKEMNKMKFYNTLSTERIGYDFYCDIANKMVEGRRLKGWTQADLAKASGLKVSRISDMENVKFRFTLPDIERLAKALDVSVDWLIDAHLDCHGKECLYLVWNEKFDSWKPYQEATSARMAFLKAYQKFCVELYRRWFEPRDRAIVKLVGVPIEKAELEAMFPKQTSEDTPIFPDEN